MVETFKSISQVLLTHGKVLDRTSILRLQSNHEVVLPSPPSEATVRSDRYYQGMYHNSIRTSPFSAWSFLAHNLNYPIRQSYGFYDTFFFSIQSQLTSMSIPSIPSALATTQSAPTQWPSAFFPVCVSNTNHFALQTLLLEHANYYPVPMSFLPPRIAFGFFLCKLKLDGAFEILLLGIFCQFGLNRLIKTLKKKESQTDRSSLPSLILTVNIIIPSSALLKHFVISQLMHFSLKLLL